MKKRRKKEREKERNKGGFIYAIISIALCSNLADGNFVIHQSPDEAVLKRRAIF